VVEAGDEVVYDARSSSGVSVAEITRLYAHSRDDIPAMRRAIEAEGLPDVWRSWFNKRLAAQSTSA
jgi:MOSC domain-containing protein YiiM